MSDTTEALRAALAAGPTPGPYIVRVGSEPYAAGAKSLHANVTSANNTRAIFGQKSNRINGRTQQRIADLHFAAAACNAAPELLAELDRITAERDALRGQQGVLLGWIAEALGPLWKYRPR